MRLDLRRVNPFDSQEPAWPKSWYAWITHAGLESLRYALPGSIFLFKLLEWWYSSASLRPSARMTSSDNVLPPIRPPVKPRALVEPKQGECPVCQGDIVNPTSFESGYVGCYKCAWRFVSEKGACPVTGLSMTVGGLRKIVG